MVINSNSKKKKNRRNQREKESKIKIIDLEGEISARQNLTGGNQSTEFYDALFKSYFKKASIPVIPT